MKISIFLFLFLVFCAESWAQLTCTNCAFTVNGVPLEGTQERPASILDSPGMFEGIITLTGDCVFTILGTGNYTLAGQILGTGTVTFNAPNAGAAGDLAGITLGGATPNGYTGQTTVSSGYLICNKVGGGAVPNDLKISAAASGLAAHVWCLADNQFGTSTVIDFSEARQQSLLHLNGTTQAIGGLARSRTTSGVGGVENRENLYLPAGMTADQFSANVAILNITAAATSPIFGGGIIRKGLAASPALTVNILSGTQVIQDPTGNIHNVTFTSALGAILELNSSSNATSQFGGNVSFTGNGNIVKTGTGDIEINNSTLLKPTGQIRVSGGVLRNAGNNNIYTNSTGSNQSVLHTDANGTFDMGGNVSIFGGLTGAGVVRNNLGVSASPPGGGYSWLTVGQNNSQDSPAFEGIIQDNSSNNQVSAAGSGTNTGGIALKKVGTGIQVLKGANRYTGMTTVTSGTLKLQDGGQLGGGTYGGALEIANVAAQSSQAVFEHNGTQSQIFSGAITNTGEGAVKGKFLQSGTGKSIINGVNTFTGQVNVTGGFLGGSGSLKHAAGVTVGAGSSIGGGNGADVGGTLTVTGLIFEATSKLVVTAMSATDNTPSLVDVKVRGTDTQAAITVTGAFTVDVLGGNVTSGRLIKCDNSAGNPPFLPVIGLNITGRAVTFGWQADGLYMTITQVSSGLACNNCSFSSGSQTIVGTSANPAFILPSPGGFPGNIVTTGDCHFTIMGTGNYTLSGQISGPGRVTFDALNAGPNGKEAGVTLSGTTPNNYTGQTILKNGYLICHKTSAVAVPANLKMVAVSADKPLHLWCLADNQLSETTVVDFTGTAKSCLHLNGTTQTIAGLLGNTNGAEVENTNADSRPAGMTADQISANPATLNIKAGTGSYSYGGGAHIRKGGGSAAALTVNVMNGTFIIKNPDNHINNVTLTSAAEATLEFNTNYGTYKLGGGLTFRGAGLIKKTGPGTIAPTGATYLKTAGKIWVSEGIWQNESAHNSYFSGNESNQATLQVDAPNATFDLMSDASIFSGLTGGGWIRNNWGYHGRNGYDDFTLNQNDTATPATFAGVIQNNSSNGASVSGNGPGTGGIRLKKGGNGTQVLTGVNTYTGTTTVLAGKLKLAEGAKLGGGTYGGALEIANVTVSPSASQAIFEHAGTQTQIFNGDITNTVIGTTKGTFLQSGSGKSIINKSIINNVATPKSFTGQVNIIGGFLGGSGSLKNATAVEVGASGSIGGGTGVVLGGDTLTVAALSLAAGSKIIVSSIAGTNNRPSLVRVVTSTGASGTLTVPTTVPTGRFKVDIVGTSVASGYILTCANGAGLPLPVLGQHSFSAGGLLPTFRWDAQGLYMETPMGITCNNCTFGTGATAKRGTLAAPVRILSAPGTFAGDINLEGDCQFVITGIGNYTFSGQITGNASLTYIADTREETYVEGSPTRGGNSAGVTLTGSRPNIYTGLTTIQSGYLICTKNNGVAAVPHDLKISARADGQPARIWFYSNNHAGNVYGNNQLGNGSTIVDFTDTGNDSYFHLNGTTQTIAGLKVNNNKVTVHNHTTTYQRPEVAGWGLYNITQGDAYGPPPGVININITGNNTYTFAGGSIFHRSPFNNFFPPPELIVNITGGTQIIENPTSVSQLELVPASSGTLELKTINNALYQLGGAGINVVTLRGDGTIKKTGVGTIAMAHSRILKSGGKIWVFEGTLRNAGTPLYISGTESNKSVLEVEAPHGSNTPAFDLWGNHSLFAGLTGGGWVQNNWGTSTEGGYNYLTLNRDNTATSVFSGIIRDNSSNNQVVANGLLRNGGIRLKKEGIGTQVLTGANRYTGTTIVSAGTLKLQVGGQLGSMFEDTYRGTYTGVLEIANSVAPSQAVFEHNGTQAQVFAGNITNTGDGAVKGKFLQSGSGKSIINGATPISFTGHVNITGGYLGGSGDLRNATDVTVGAEGSIGGGDNVAANGGTLTVANLIFASATSKLVVSSTPGSTSGLSLVEVKTGAGAAGTITAAHGFKVKLTGNLVSGHILKCSNGVGLPVPTLDELPANSNMEGKVRFVWDSQGLFMQVRKGTIALAIGNANMVCSKGTNPGNPLITFEATYSDVLDLPPPGAPDDYFTLSNNEAKSGIIRVTREGNKIKAEFDGVNTTAADLPYTITYDDHLNPVVTSGAQKINRPVTLSTATGLAHVCFGTPLVLQAAGNGAVTITSTDTNTTLAPNTAPALSATATTTVAGIVNFMATDVDGCKSEYLEVDVKALPVISPPTPALCVNTSLILTANREPVVQTGNIFSAWAITSTASTTALLEDLAPADNKVNFKAASTAQEGVTVEYTDVFACKVTTTVAIRTDLTLTHTTTTPVCSDTKTDILLIPSLSYATYEWTVDTNTVGAKSQTTPFTSPHIKQTLTNNGNEPLVSVTYRVKGTSGICVTDWIDVPVQVSNLRRVANVTGEGQYCADPETGRYQTNIIPAVEGGVTGVEWKYSSYFSETQAAISGNSQMPNKAALTEVRDNLLLSGNEPAWVNYVFSPFKDCLGTPDTIRITLHPAPVATAAVRLSTVCSSSDPSHPKANITLRSAAAGMVYTWTVDKANSPDVTGYSEPSIEGASAPGTNPTAARPSPVQETLSLPDAISKAQAIRYRMTPWRNGCPGKAVLTDVSVYPRPKMMGLTPAISICSIGGRTAISLVNNFSEPEKYRVTYSWTVESHNLAGVQPALANQRTFIQQLLSLNANATDGSLTYTFTPKYTPAGTTTSCAGLPVTTAYSLVTTPVAATFDKTAVEACLGDAVTLTATPEGGSFQWLKNDNTIADATGSSYTVATTELTEDEYKVRNTNACGTRDSGAKKVKVTSDAYFTSGNAVAVADKAEGFVSQPMKFNYTGPAAVFSWDFDDQTPASIEQNPSHTYLKEATYNPKLKLEKQGQAACNKTINLRALKINVAPISGDPNRSVSLSVFPVPAHDRLTIVNEGDLRDITISDLSGKTVLRQAVNGREAILSIGHLTEGIYILTVTDSKGVQRLKISKN